MSRSTRTGNARLAALAATLLITATSWSSGSLAQSTPASDATDSTLGAFPRADQVIPLGTSRRRHDSTPACPRPATPQREGAGVLVQDVALGAGRVMQVGDAVALHLTIWAMDCTLLADSRGAAAPSVIRGASASTLPPALLEVLTDMQPGGRRHSWVPDHVSDGLPGAGSGTGLILDVELLEAWPAIRRPDSEALELVENPSGLRWADLRVGEGPVVERGGAARIHYEGWLDDGTWFASSRSMPLGHALGDVGGSSGLMPGLNEGLLGMRESGRRLLVVPPALGLGSSGHPPHVPGGATLTFVVDVRAVGATVEDTLP